MIDAEFSAVYLFLCLSAGCGLEWCSLVFGQAGAGECMWALESACLGLSVGLCRAVPEEELGAKSLLESVLIEVVAETDIEDYLAACDEAEDLVVVLTAYLYAVDYITDVD